ncbi:hypothetical protein DFH07DRAFT_958636 [Mycena maculata]|uniref:CxC5 like cysteine cluster associated with KDZ domain-containing protein n=1 Tax=Mycena maculata TaxID=230809 RepID=A0AAD7J5V6_9AGAR|nr:hypothetical protein DFH07DRAFT_958636 [Mycena maculata]
MDFPAALRRDTENTDLKDVSLTQMMTFLRLLSVLKDDILLPQPIDISVHKPPLLLPPTIATFVSKATGIDSESISACWSLLKEEVWSLPRPELSMAEEGLFRDNGWKMGPIQAGIRTYYGDTPNYIQIGEHQFAERKLIAMWISLMLLAWYSALVLVLPKV